FYIQISKHHRELNLYFTFNFRSPKMCDHKLIKRIIALEGDFVKISTNKIIQIPKGHCWVEGDNTSQSLDSKHFGPVAIGLIHAQATHVLWPLQRWSKLSNEVPEDNDRVV
ncbi:hypothetical protein B4U79_07920, partial [Dinothrombium tinctorium]